MKNIEKLIKEYGKLCLIPVSELIKALEKDFINIENLQIACVPQDKLTRNFAKETTQCLFLVKKEDVDREVLRLGMIAELDAINLYEQLAATSENENIKETLLDIAREEKTHMGEFQDLLLKLDKEQVRELEAGKKEVDEKIKE